MRDISYNIILNCRHDEYVVEKWMSLHEGTIFLRNSINAKDMKLLRQKYATISFEKYELHLKLSKIFNHVWSRNMIVIWGFESIKELIKKVANTIIR